MASKLKILVDYPCQVYCNLEHIGDAQPDQMFVVNLRKGKYFLEFKTEVEIGIKGNGTTVNESFVKTYDYIMQSNDEEDLLKITLLNQIQVQFVNIPEFHIKRYYPNPGRSNTVYLKTNVETVELNKKTSVRYLEAQGKISSVLRFHLCYTDMFYSDESTTDYQEEQTLLFHDLSELSDQTIFIDDFYDADIGPSFIIYTDKKIYIYHYSMNKLLYTVDDYPNIGMIYSMNDGYALFLKDSKFGILNLTNKVIECNPAFDEIFNHSEAYDEDIKHFYINKEKTFIVKNNGKYGKIDLQGNIIVPIKYQSVYSTSNFPDIIEQNNKWGFYSQKVLLYDDLFIFWYSDYTGKIKRYHDNIPDVKLICYQIGDKIGVINDRGIASNVLLDEIHTEFLWRCQSGRIIPIKSNGKEGILDVYGYVHINCIYDDICYIFDEDDLNLYIDYLYYFHTNSKTSFYIEWEKEMLRKGILSIGYIKDEAYQYIQIPKVIVCKDGKYGVIGLDNKIYIPLEYDLCDEFHNSSNEFLVKKNELYGLVNISNQNIAPLKYSNIEELEQDQDSIPF